MGPTDVTRGILAAFGQFADSVTVYAVAAASVTEETVGAVVVGVLEVRPVVSTDLDVGVASESVVFITDSTSAAAIVPRATSIEFDGVLYDVVRRVPDYPGAVEFHLREFV